MVTSSMSYLLLFFGYFTSNFISSEETSLTGRRTPCHNEGEEVQLDQKYFQPCFKCICQNGFVECETESCPAVDDCYALVKKPAGECCDKCKDCLFNGQIYESGTEWTGGPEDPCTHYKCVAGVVTESQMKCYTPCSNPSPPRPGQCCPTCLGCHLNGQNLMEDGNVREVTLTEDPCVKCHCSGKRLTCTKKACPVLQCPPSLQFLPEGQCCKKCAKNIDYIKPSKGGCILNGQYYASSMAKEMWVDRCSTCSCYNESSICRRNTCPVLECSQEYQETKPGECCPYCVLPAEVKTVCVYGDVTYQNNQTWNMSPCRSCSCQSGEIRCAQTQCPEIRCRPNEKAVVPDGECCSRCEEIPSVCTVFGDPHYKTFDGKFFSFQGSCKYQLTADCVDHTFSIRVTNDARSTKFSSWTKTVTLKMMNVKINLGQKLRVKVNGTRVLLPYKLHNVVHIIKGQDDEINVETALGIKLVWDGYSFLQVEAPVTYKNKLCGLCGNYNNIYRDDLTTRHGHNLTDNEVRKFAESWRVGGLRACARKPNENPHKPQHCASKRQRAGYCKYLKTEDIFENCNLRINYDKYFEFCKMDMCECPSQKCYCESFTAYAHECQRHGISLAGKWRENAGCKLNTLHNRKNEISHRPKHEKQNHGKRNHFRWKTPTPPSLLNKQHIPKTVIHAYSGRTPPPLF